MEYLEKGPVLEFHPDTLQEVRRAYGLDKPGKMDEAIDILEDWVKKQPHFVKKDFSRKYLEVTIITAKGSVEKAKRRLDKYCTMRTMIPKFFDKYDVKTQFEDFHKTFYMFPMPKLTKDHRRIFIVKLGKRKMSAEIALDFYKYLAVCGEYYRTNDYHKGYIILLDYSDFNMMDFMPHLSLIDMKHGLDLFIDGYGTRIKGIHIMSHSDIVDVFLSLAKQYVSTKIANRIYVHKTIDTIYESIPKDLLPVDYGGKEGSLKTLRELWINVLSSKEHINLVQEMNKATINEAYRTIEDFNNHYLGLPGTFRSLSVD